MRGVPSSSQRHLKRSAPPEGCSTAALKVSDQPGRRYGTRVLYANDVHVSTELTEPEIVCSKSRTAARARCSRAAATPITSLAGPTRCSGDVAYRSTFCNRPAKHVSALIFGERHNAPRWSNDRGRLDELQRARPKGLMNAQGGQTPQTSWTGAGLPVTPERKVRASVTHNSRDRESRQYRGGERAPKPRSGKGVGGASVSPSDAAAMPAHTGRREPSNQAQGPPGDRRPRKGSRDERVNLWRKGQ